MSFDNAYFTPTYYIVATEHELRVRAAKSGAVPRRGRRSRRRSS